MVYCVCVKASLSIMATQRQEGTLWLTHAPKAHRHTSIKDCPVYVQSADSSTQPAIALNVQCSALSSKKVYIPGSFYKGKGSDLIVIFHVIGAVSHLQMLRTSLTLKAAIICS